MSGNVRFDPERARGPREQADVVGRPDAGTDVTGEFVPGPSSSPPMTVSALLARIKDALADGLDRRLAVAGELSNVKRAVSGHLYFTLKDDLGQLAAVMFRPAAQTLRFEPTDGLEVVAEGRVDVYEVQGRLQLYVDRLTPRGQGALELAFRQLVERLRAQGLFAPERKRALPRFPMRIGVVTSPTGAAIRDIARVLTRRWPAARVLLLPVSVQGEAAAGQIAAAINAAAAQARRLGLEVLIVARGGGSLEDLWCFNAEPVARAIHDCTIPVVTGIGHEVDTTVADLVADVRAATPTAAAELATPDRQHLARALAGLGETLSLGVRRRLQDARMALRLVRRGEFFRNPLHRVQGLQQRLDESCSRLRAALWRRSAVSAAGVARLTTALHWQLGGLARRQSDLLAEWRAALAGAHPVQQLRLARGQLEAHRRQMGTLMRALLAQRAAQVSRQRQALEALSYRGVLARGYSVTRDEAGRIIRRPADVSCGQVLRTELAEGEVRSVVADGPGDARRAPGKPRRPAADAGPSLFDPGVPEYP